MTRMRKKRKSGSRAVRLLLALAMAGSVAALGAPPERSRKAETFALISGTVFRDTGFSLPGAGLVLDIAPGTNPPRKFKKIKFFSDARGEFAVRVPPAPMRYTVSVRAAGYKPETKEVSVQGEDRLELFFRLEPESK